jgi:hypothetical protein
MWTKLRSRLERFDFKPEPNALRIEGKVEPDLHLWGRPFLIFENSVERVSTFVEEYLQAKTESTLQSLVIEQLLRIDPRLPAELQPAEVHEPTADMTYRNELLDQLKSIHAIARDARVDDGSGPLLAQREPSADRLYREVPWRAVWLHSRAMPFWIGRDVDGLETICRSAEVEPPDVLVPGWRLFSGAIEVFPDLRDSLTTNLERDQDVGAFVSAPDIPELLAFLNQHGARIIQAATREGVGPLCASVLKKIRECAYHAQRLGMGYLEASGIMPVAFDPDNDDHAEENPPS